MVHASPFSGLLKRLAVVLLPVLLIVSCKKDTGGGSPPPPTPKLGTTWTYRYHVYNLDGSLSSSTVVTHKATAEATLGGEKWLTVKNMTADTVVFQLQLKTDGLYHYSGGASWLLCKYPAALNDTYNGFLGGSATQFTVKSVNEVLPTGIGDVPVNYYEGYKGGNLTDQLWFHTGGWIVRKTQYRPRGILNPDLYKHSTYFLDQITY
ncbi:MAG: hypothetical protein RJA57_241 [Bacteroidota bacterium]|jgi:hypothetical protein